MHAHKQHIQPTMFLTLIPTENPFREYAVTAKDSTSSSLENTALPPDPSFTTQKDNQITVAY